MKHAKGEFDVKVTRLALAGRTEDSSLGRMSIEKEFRGDFVGIGKGQMLTAMTAVEGSAAYVAIERVAGVLEGREGSFALQHRGEMDRGKEDLYVNVVPDSGAGGLTGISGMLQIIVEGGKHSYDLAYKLPALR
jgi:hypothetical protein